MQWPRFGAFYAQITLLQKQATGQTTFLVVPADFAEGLDTFTLYLNPTPEPSPAIMRLTSATQKIEIGHNVPDRCPKPPVRLTIKAI